MAKRDSTQARPVCHTRQIKMGRIVYDYRRKDDSQASVPWLQLKGHWLDQAGFSIDTPVSEGVQNSVFIHESVWLNTPWIFKNAIDVVSNLSESRLFGNEVFNFI